MRSLCKSIYIKCQSISSLYLPKSCPIHIEDYKAGGDIAWSKNKNCYHAFHLDYMRNWLMKDDECPLCRGDYLCVDC